MNHELAAFLVFFAVSCFCLYKLKREVLHWQKNCNSLVEDMKGLAKQALKDKELQQQYKARMDELRSRLSAERNTNAYLNQRIKQVTDQSRIDISAETAYWNKARAGYYNVRGDFVEVDPRNANCKETPIWIGGELDAMLVKAALRRALIKPQVPEETQTAP